MTQTAEPHTHTENGQAFSYCDARAETVRVLSPELSPARADAIRLVDKKWVNGTVLHYFFSGGPEPQRNAVRSAFAEWKGLGIGLEFVEVTDRDDAEVRIAFDQNDGSWSYVGRDVLGIAQNEPTMNFGWDLTTSYGRTTALHEIGHTLGMPHEHQNPFSGIKWDEEKVYETLGGPPNNWSREQTFHNVLRKLSTHDVEGSAWDPSSVMEYAFPAGLIIEPTEYRNGINPPGGLSALDQEWARNWFPPLEATIPTLEAFKSVPLSLAIGEQADFSITPTASRRYEIATFGAADTLIVLFEDVDGDLRYVRGDDDSGVDRNARLSLKLFEDRKYVLRVRLYYAGASGQTAVMYW